MGIAFPGRQGTDCKASLAADCHRILSARLAKYHSLDSRTQRGSADEGDTSSRLDRDSHLDAPGVGLLGVGLLGAGLPGADPAHCRNRAHCQNRGHSPETQLQDSSRRRAGPSLDKVCCTVGTGIATRHRVARDHPNAESDGNYQTRHRSSANCVCE